MIDMLSFREFCEEFRKAEGGSDGFGIFKNPTPEEIKKLLPAVRGILTGAGDLYIANDTGGLSFHNELAKRAINFYKDRTIAKAMTRDKFIGNQRVREPKNPNNGVTMQHIGGNVFGIGETEFIDSKGRDQLKALFKKAKKKNPGLKFTDKKRN